MATTVAESPFLYYGINIMVSIDLSHGLRLDNWEADKV
jgi:hypothetical protein